MAVRYDRIRELMQARTSRGVSVRQIALQAGVRMQTLYEIQAGDEPGLAVDTVVKLCRYFGVRVEYLVELDSEPALAS